MAERKRPYRRRGLEENDAEQDVQPLTGRSALRIGGDQTGFGGEVAGPKQEVSDNAGSNSVMSSSNEDTSESKQMEEFDHERRRAATQKQRENLAEPQSFQEEHRLEPGAFRVRGHNARDDSVVSSEELSSSGELLPENMPYSEAVAGASVPIAQQIDERARRELEQTREQINAMHDIVGGDTVAATLEAHEDSTVTCSRTRLLCSVSLLLIGAAISTAVAVAVSGKSTGESLPEINATVLPSSVPSPSVSSSLAPIRTPSMVVIPTLEPTIARAEYWYTVAVEVSGSELIQNTESAQFRALDWLQNKDLLPIPQTYQHGIERYVLVVLYFSTSGNQWTNQYNFLSVEEPVCMWNDFQDGCDCDFEGNLIELSLSENQLDGPLPSELGQLQSLRRCFLAKNALSGTLPTELGLLRNVQSLTIWLDSFHGPIPSEIGNMRALTFLDLSNQKSVSSLTGTIPTELGLLANLESLSLNSNSLTGALPTEFRNLSNLSKLHLYRNNLQGNFDPILCNTSREFQFVDGLSADCGESGLVTCSC